MSSALHPYVKKELILPKVVPDRLTVPSTKKEWFDLEMLAIQLFVKRLDLGRRLAGSARLSTLRKRSYLKQSSKAPNQRKAFDSKQHGRGFSPEAPETVLYP